MLLWNLLQLWKGSLEKVLSNGEFGFIKKMRGKNATIACLPFIFKR